jgi:hypothetical protein
MKITHLKTLFFTGLLCNIAHAASSIQLQVGEFKNASGATVVTGTWLVILDANNDGILPGNLAAGPTSNGALQIANAAQIADDFSGITLSLGAIGADQIIGVGTVGDVDLGDGFATSPISFVHGQEGSAYGVYWIPDLNPNDPIPTSAAFQIGGYFQSNPDDFLAYGMFAPPFNVAFEPAVISVSSFTAVAIPEPTTVALSALAAFGLLRRRRA